MDDTLGGRVEYQGRLSEQLAIALNTEHLHDGEFGDETAVGLAGFGRIELPGQQSESTGSRGIRPDGAGLISLAVLQIGRDMISLHVRFSVELCTSCTVRVFRSSVRRRPEQA